MGKRSDGETDKVFPHPEQWTLEHVPERKPLDQIGINEIYRALTANKRPAPNCIKNWDRRLNIDIPWRAIGGNIAKGLGSNRDTSSWFKNILHRALYLKGKGGQDTACSACHQENEDWLHLWQCPVWEPIWQKLTRNVNEIIPEMQGMERVMMGPAFIYLGIMDEDTTPHALPISLALLHAIIWKFIILELYKKSQNEHYIIKPEAVERSALRRYATRIRAKLRRAQIALAKSVHRGYEHSNDNINKKLQPVARIDDECKEICWHPVIHGWLAQVGAEEHDNIKPTFTPEW